ncbi:MAG: hypothetical protein ACR2GY_01425 [Phycisphaerales bacterium]
MTMPTEFVKEASVQLYHMLIYRKPVEFSPLLVVAESEIVYGKYTFRQFLTRGGHALQFETGGHTITEIITEGPEVFSEAGQLLCVPCAGERDHEETLNDAVSYCASVQTESLTESLYLSQYREMLEHSSRPECMHAVWDDQGANLSLLDVQRYRDEIHVQGYHLRSDCKLILRTQSIFTVGVLEAAG